MRKKILFTPLFILSTLTVVSPVFLTSCSSGGLVIANFEGYMSDDVISGLKKDSEIKSSLRFLYYATNEDIETKFKKYYDIAIPSTYEVISLLMKNQLERIKWDKFNLEKIDQTGIPPVTNGIQITNGDDAMTLFSPTAQSILESATEYINTESNWPNGFPEWYQLNVNQGFDNILDYGIPYFLQDWVFAYKSDDVLINQQGMNATYNDILNIVSPHGENFNNYFKPHGTVRIGMIEDARSVFDFAKIISTENSPEPCINPPNGSTTSEYEQTYKSITNKFDKDYFWLNSDSSQMNISLATPLSKGGLNSAFTYNGDILYAAQGSDLNAGVDPNSSKYIRYYGDSDHDPNHLHMHVYRPHYVPAMMDMMVINKNSIKSKTENDLYRVILDVCLDSANLNLNDNNINELMHAKFSFQNFQYTSYTDPLSVTDWYIRNNYFNVSNVTEFPNYDLLNEIYSMNPSNDSNLIENPISDMDKSNMYWAFIKQRELL